MDLSSMLNDEPTITANADQSDQPLSEDYIRDRKTLLHISTTLQFLVAADAKRTSQRLQQQQQRRPAAAAEGPSIPSDCPIFGPELVNNPGLWQPVLFLKSVSKDQPVLVNTRSHHPANTTFPQPGVAGAPVDATNDIPIPLVTQEVVYRGDEPKLLLEKSYEIQGAYPRGFFVMMAKQSIQHNFVFRYPDHPWFEDLYGLRKSAYITLRTAEGEIWEMHLKSSRDKKYLFGYLWRHEDMIAIVRSSLDNLLYQRKLPLVLDLDDTLVRLVSEGNDRHVSAVEAAQCGDRVATLKDGRRVVLTERVHEFLDWAQNFYDISVCSLGDQQYVDNVVQVLDPQRTRIRGILYSARFEHDYIKRSPDPGRPPKDLLALYSFCALRDKSLGSEFSLPLILDDETRMWPTDQHDNIIVVKQQANSSVWNVNLFPVVQETLAYIHQEFFRQFDSWKSKVFEAQQNGTVCTREPPSAIAIYKTYLRSILRDIIAARRP